ncbi:MAG: hypothetical protein J7D61_07715 [Marichromatium sp.]|nr:hypothetical protein [Marichromatium sp.]
MALIERRASIIRLAYKRAQIWESVDSRLEVSGQKAFLAAAHNEGAALSDIARELDISSSAAFRWLAYWGTGSWQLNKTRREGKGYLVTRPDPEDSRVKRVYLTERGRELVDRLVRLDEQYWSKANADPQDD